MLAAFAVGLKSGQEIQRKVRKRTGSVESRCGEGVYLGYSVKGGVKRVEVFAHLGRINSLPLVNAHFRRAKC